MPPSKKTTSIYLQVIDVEEGYRLAKYISILETSLKFSHHNSLTLTK